MPASGHLAYFSSLEKTIKVALAFYLLVLVVGSTLLYIGLVPAWLGVRRTTDGTFFAISILLAAFLGMYLIVSRIHWLGKLHIWLDQRFFGFLDKSNEIIFGAVVRVLESDERSTVSELESQERHSMIRTLFSRLAENFHLFDELMASGIFRAWIWYWVLNYGTFTFSFLTLASFLTMLGGGHSSTRTMFTLCWVAALSHLTVNVVLGNALTRMTRKVSESIVQAYKPQIILMLRESFSR